MDEKKDLAEPFERSRAHLRAVAYRMLGSKAEADDAVQEAWLRLSRSDTSEVENLRGWLTTVVARVCLDMLRSRKARREDQAGEDDPEPAPPPPALPGDGLDPEGEVLLADSVGAALLVVLETLTPAERVALVLHDMFDLSFEEIGPILARSPVATRQLASRARRRVQGAAPGPDPDLARRREVVDAFVAAARGGRFEALLAILAPEVVVRADAAAMKIGAAAELRGSEAAATRFASQARGAERAVVDGLPAAVWAPGGLPRVALLFTIAADGKIAAIDLVADPQRLREMDVVLVD